MTVNYIDATTVQQFNFSIKWMQIDNQLYGGLEPIFMYPTNIPRDGEEEFKPVLFCTYTKSKDTCKSKRRENEYGSFD